MEVAPATAVAFLSTPPLETYLFLEPNDTFGDMFSLLRRQNCLQTTGAQKITYLSPRKRESEHTHAACTLPRHITLASTKGLFTLDTQCALNRIESGLSASTLNAHSPNLDPLILIHFQRWFRSGLIWIAQLHIRTKKAWHTCSCRLYQQ